jgi:putative glycosyltransferase (TIGR04372 family)
LLRKLGIPKGAKWVCLIVRDNAYMKAKFPQNDWSYHDYRDANLEDYMYAAQNLIVEGYYVVRMGEVVAEQLPIKHTKLIDYPPQRTEFGDLYLGANCEFCIGTPCGFMMIPQVFQRPLCMTDFAPIEYFTTFVEGLIIWKHHIRDDKEMTIREIAESGAGLAGFTPQFAQIGITLKNNTPEEIKEVAMEMCERFKNNGHQAEYDEEDSQGAFWNSFPRSIVNGKPLHGKIKVRIGRAYLEAYNAGVSGHS